MADAIFRCNFCDPLGVDHRKIFTCCLNCGLKLCEKCQQLHIESCQSVLKDKLHLCALHDQYFNGFCSVCKCLVCGFCRDYSHHKHYVLTISDAFYAIDKEIFGSIQELETRIKQEDHFKEDLKRTLDKYKSLLKKVSEDFARQQYDGKTNMTSEDDARVVLEELKTDIEDVDSWLSCISQEFSKLLRVKQNLEYLLGERNPLLFLAKWENPNPALETYDKFSNKLLESLNSKFTDNFKKLDNQLFETSGNSSAEDVDALIGGLENLNISRGNRVTGADEPEVCVPDDKTLNTSIRSNVPDAESKIRFMLGVTECLPKLIESIKTDFAKRETIQIPKKHQDERMNTFVERIEIAYNQIIEFENELFDLHRKFHDVKKELKVRDKTLEELHEKFDNQSILGSLFGYGSTKYPALESSVDCESDLLKKRLEVSQEEAAKQLSLMQAAIDQIKKDKDDLQSRLSLLAGEQLTKGNPAITDLSDPNRPMKLGEKYGELYDNEWTDNIDHMNKMSELFPTIKTLDFEEVVIQHMYRLLMVCYKECKSRSEEQLMAFGMLENKETLDKKEHDQANEKSNETKGPRNTISGERKKSAEAFANYLYENRSFCRNATSGWNYDNGDETMMDKLKETDYFKRCVFLCWNMVVQDPIMYLEDELTKGVVFDKHSYKEFVQKGDKVQYVVWPALYLYKDGPLLYKGVVQAYRDKKDISKQKNQTQKTKTDDKQGKSGEVNKETDPEHQEEKHSGQKDQVELEKHDSTPNTNDNGNKQDFGIQYPAEKQEIDNSSKYEQQTTK